MVAQSYSPLPCIPPTHLPRCIQLRLIHVDISANMTELEIVLEVMRVLGTLITILVCKTWHEEKKRLIILCLITYLHKLGPSLTKWTLFCIKWDLKLANKIIKSLGKWILRSQIKWAFWSIPKRLIMGYFYSQRSHLMSAIETRYFKALQINFPEVCLFYIKYNEK